MKSKLIKNIFVSAAMTFAAFTNVANAGLISQWQVNGFNETTNDPSTTAQISAHYSDPVVTAGNLFSLTQFDTNNTDVLPHGMVTSSPLADLSEYVQFGITSTSTAIEYSSVDYWLQSYLGTGAQTASIRSSLDGYANDIDVVDVLTDSTQAQKVMFDLTTIGQVSGAIDFRVYFYNAVSSDTDWADLSSLDGGEGLKLYGEVAQVPEPSTLAIFALGMIGLISRRFKKQS